MNKKTILLLALIMIFWFAIAFISNILGPLIPDIIDNFKLKDLTMAGFLPTSLFLAYALMSIPSGILIEKYGEKAILLVGFIIPCIGTTLFALIPTYSTLLISCFIIGIGMAMLQTVLNPLQRAVGGDENYAFIGQFTQFVYGGASFVGPLVYSKLIMELNPHNYIAGKSIIIDGLHSLVPPNMPWVSLYWVFTFLLIIMIASVILTKFPRIEQDKEEANKSNNSGYAQLFKNKYVWLFFLGIFSTLCIQQGVSIFMSTFLKEYHGVNPQIEGANAVAYFWGNMTIGSILGLFLVRLFDSRKILIGGGILATILLILAITGSKEVALIAFPAIGFSISMMFSTIFSLALNSVTSHHGAFAGILCTGIFGGAGGPLLVSLIANATNLKVGMFVIIIMTIFVTSIGFWARPLVNNKTVKLSELFKNKQVK